MSFTYSEDQFTTHKFREWIIDNYKEINVIIYAILNLCIKYD